MEKKVFLLPLLSLATLFVVVDGYSGGADPGACDSMTPGHGSPSQGAPSPYTITPSTTTLTAGGTITVTLTGSSDFKGFLIQAREPGTTNYYGSWLNLPSTAQKKCTNDRAVTHTSDSTKSSIALEWQAPSSLGAVTEIEFVATVVQSFQTYWVQLTKTTVSASGTTPVPPPTTTPAPQPDITIDLAGCGTTRSCYRFPEGCTTTDCDFIVTWKNGASGKVDFELSARSDGYVAMGLNTAQKMDGTSVTACSIQTSGVVKVFQNFNTGYSCAPITPDDQVGLSTTVGSYKDNYITCTFTRDSTISPSNSQVTDLDKDLYMIVAVGDSSNGFVTRHSSTPPITSETINPTAAEFASINKPTAPPPSTAIASKLEQAHGIMMLTGWMLFASVGIVLARYYKGTWAESKLCGEKVWFAVHRFLMVSNCILTIAACALIFIDAKRWSSWGVAAQDAHPIIGVTVTGLVIINPLMALCRPHPGTSKRPIFNWAHWGVGTAAHILAITNIFLGMNLPSGKAFTPSIAMWIMVGFVVVHAIVEIVLEVEKCKKSRRSGGGNDMEMKDINSGGGAADQEESGTLKVVIGLYILIALGSWVAIVLAMIGIIDV